MRRPYVAGATAFIVTGAPGLELGLPGSDLTAWTVLDSVFRLTGLAWRLSGQFDSVRRAVEPL